jgi:hypothetical protein
MGHIRAHIAAQAAVIAAYYVLTAFVQWDWAWLETVGGWRPQERVFLLLPLFLASFISHLCISVQGRDWL